MEREFEIEFNTADSDEVVFVAITYKILEDYKGCNEFGKSVFTLEMTDLKATLHKLPYIPPTADLAYWKIDRAIEKDFQNRDMEAA